MSEQELEDILVGKGAKETTLLESLVNIMTSPIAKRKGLMLSKEDTAEYAEEIKKLIAELYKVKSSLITAFNVDVSIKSSAQSVYIDNALKILSKLL